MLWIRLAFRALRLSHHARSLPPSSRSPHVSSRVLARVHAASRGDIRDASVLVPRRRSHPAGVAIVPLRTRAGRSVRRFLTNPDTTSDGISIHSAPSSPPTRTTSPPRSPAAATHAGAETSARSTTRKRARRRRRTPPLSRGGSPRVITHPFATRTRDDGGFEPATSGFRTCDMAANVSASGAYDDVSAATDSTTSTATRHAGRR